MPPALTDDEGSSNGDEIPHQKDTYMSDVDNGDEDGDDEDGEEYVVEAILNHAFDDDGILKYEVKWLGYEKKSDRTWEPKSNLKGAKDLLLEYHKSIGGEPKRGGPGPGRKRKQSGTPTVRATSKQARRKPKVVKNGDDEQNPSTKSKIKSEPTWEPPPGLWEDEVVSVESVEQTIDVKTGDPALMGYIVWADERKTQHSLKLLYRKCPQKMLQYYERHLVFKPNEVEAPDEMKDEGL